ncbi:unnamed protein product [Bursaphelenchus xylophilus]|uniref:Elongation of very long chain fatty acids protein n=1 Tax=Bursaphelenchus xylophilus TaxID=6326 RepID=A0A1I7RPZ9_BURXY|nr:unnamed protein product [Bursaphelenchus xylophilus]CAG9096904.1 unnamed protein product [Bursaphelenchus xylophilus]
MKNKKPYKPRSYLISWNVGLAVFSMMGTIRMASEFFFVLSTRDFKDSVCLAINPTDISALWACLFVVSKVFELVDTLFLILKKKPVIFLHWYHHAIVLVYCWHSAIMLTAASRWFIMMNYAVHSVMYTYYGLTAYGLRFPKLISMSITTLQTVQMIVGVYISCYVALVKWYYHDVCHQSDSNLLFCFGIYLSFAVLFMNFFIKSYLSKGALKKKDT